MPDPVKIDSPNDLAVAIAKGLPPGVLMALKDFMRSRKSGSITLHIADGVIRQAKKAEDLM